MKNELETGEILLLIIALSTLIAYVFCLFFYPLVRAWVCKIGDCYEKKYTDNNPFSTRKVKDQFIITGKENGYIKYDKIEFYVTTNGYEFSNKYSSSYKAYSWFVIYSDLKKVKNI